MARKDKEAPAEQVAETEVKERKSIVPAGWKSKNDVLKQFVDEQSTGKDGFEYTAFFALCRKSGIPEAEVAKYEGVVASNAHGGKGRAKMTLRNMLVPIIRKSGKAIGLDGTEHSMDLPKAPVSGAAAKAKEAAA